MISTVLNATHILTNLILTTALRRMNYYIYLTVEETEAQVQMTGK